MEKICGQCKKIETNAMLNCCSEKDNVTCKTPPSVLGQVGGFFGGLIGQREAGINLMEWIPFLGGGNKVDITVPNIMSRSNIDVVPTLDDACKIISPEYSGDENKTNPWKRGGMIY